MNLASHLLRDAYSKRFKVAVTVTNDSDLAEPVRIVAQEIGLPVGLLNPISSIAVNCDSTPRSSSAFVGES